MSTPVKMSMWGTSFAEFEIDVEHGWNLYLGPKHHIPVSPCYKNGRLSIEYCGVEIRDDKNFLSKRPY